MSSAFVHLHTHSSYSPMDGVPTLEALCHAVHAQGQDTFALTDTNGLYGAIHFLDVARDTRLTPILGAELVHETHRAVLLAKTPTGYANLCRILSARHCDERFDFIGAIAHHRAGLVILSDDLTALTAWSQDSTDDLYVELTSGLETHEAVAFSRERGLPPVATTRATFLRPADYQAPRHARARARSAPGPERVYRRPPHGRWSGM